MVPEQLEQIVKNYGFYNRLPKSQDIGNALSFKPKILERKTILQRVGDKIQDFINTFIEGMGWSNYFRNSKLAIIDKMMLITIEEVMGINKDLFSSSIRISPGSFPNQLTNHGA